MMQKTSSRRQMLVGAAQATALGALGLLPEARAAATDVAPAKLKIGITEHDKLPGETSQGILKFDEQPI